MQKSYYQSFCGWDNFWVQVLSAKYYALLQLQIELMNTNHPTR